jgi:hypothetical protein
MSGYTMTQSELLYSCDIAGTVSVPTTTPGANAMLGYPPIVIPGGYFANPGTSYRSSSLLLEWGGLFIATATVPTFEIRIGFNQSDTWSATNVIATTGVVAAPSANTGAWFDCRLHIATRSQLIGTSTTPTLAAFSAHGVFSIWGTATATELTPQTWSLPVAAATYTPVGTFDTTVQQYLWPSVSLGAATAGNTLTTEYCKLYGQN